MTTHRIARWTRLALTVGTGTCALASTTFAADRLWIGTGGKGRGGDGTSFSDPGNWSPAVVPGALDRAIFDSVGGEILLPSGLVVNDRLLVSGEGLVLSFDLGGGVYKLNNVGDAGAARSLIVGAGAREPSDLSVSDGTVLAKHAALATAPGSEATITIFGDGALHATSSLIIGESGAAWATALGELLTGDIVLAQNAGSAGSLVVDGQSGLLLAFGDVLGGSGTVEFRILRGGLSAVLGDVALGQSQSSSVNVEVGGLGSSLLTDGDLLLGGLGESGGAGSFLVDEGGLVRSQALVAGAAMTVAVGDGRIDCTSVLAEAAPIIVGVGSMVVGAPDAETGSGFFAGLGEATAEISLLGGAGLTAPFISLGSAPGSTTDAVVEGAKSTITSFGDLELGWEPEDGATGVASLAARSGGRILVDGTLRLRQGARLHVDSDAAEVAGFDMSADEGLVLGRFAEGTDDPFIRASEFSHVGGGMYIEQMEASFSPPLGTVLSALEAPSIGGHLAAVLAQPLPGLKYYRALPYGGGKAGEGGDQVAFEVSKLDVSLGLISILPVDLPGTPNAVVAGLYDSDQFPDICVTIPGQGGAAGLCVLLVNTTGADKGDGVAGNSIFKIVDSVELGADPSGLSAADLNGDSRPDFVVSDAEGGVIQIIYNTLAAAGGGLQQGTPVPVGGSPQRVMARDLTGTGRVDLVWTDQESDQVFTSAGDGKGGFEPAVGYASGPQPSSVCPLDLDNDKDLDLAVVNTASAFGPFGEGSSVGVHLNLASEGREGFAPVILYPVGDGALGITEGDLDKDGIVDLVTANANGTLSILIGLGDSSFRPAVPVPGGGTPKAIAAGDIDNDLDDDVDIAVIVEGESGAPALTVFRNDSANGQLVLTILENAETILGLPQALAAVDTDQDGPEDLVLVGDDQGGAGGFASVLQAVPVYCPSDFDGDGMVDGADIGILLADYGAVEGSPADLNQDGVVDAVDLVLLLEGFGSCVLED